MGRKLATVAWGLLCAVLGLATSHCDRLGPMSVFPPMDLCCWCLATHTTPRGARCTRGSVTDCVQDLERLDILGSETNIRCLRNVCGRECSFIANLLPPESASRNCCDCLATQRQDGAACYQGTSEECMTEIEEGELNKLLQGGGLCTQGVCQEACAELFGTPPPEDAGQPPEDAGMEEDAGGSSSSSSSSSGGTTSGGNNGSGPTLPWDGGCPLNFPCF